MAAVSFSHAGRAILFKIPRFYALHRVKSSFDAIITIVKLTKKAARQRSKFVKAGKLDKQVLCSRGNTTCPKDNFSLHIEDQQYYAFVILSKI